MAERALAVKPTANVRAAAKKKPVPTDAHETGFEREADRAADGAMNARPWPNAPGAPEGVIPLRRTKEPESGAGRPLDNATRKIMEAHFGYDFSRVRLHTDGRASATAHARGALAYTAGSDIVFARSAYDPHSRAGRHLIAHELAHVVQQALAPSLAPAIQCKQKDAPAKAPRKWYQDVLDEMNRIDSERADALRKGEAFLEPTQYKSIKALVELCEAVDAKDKKAVPKKIDAALKVGLRLRTEIISPELFTELAARIYEIGLETDSTRLRKAYEEGDPWGPTNAVKRNTVAFLTRLVDGALGDTAFDTPHVVTASIQHFVRVFIALRDVFLQIDMDALKFEMRYFPHLLVLRPGMSQREYYDAVVEQIQRWQTGLSTLIQQAMDSARRDLESPKPNGSGAAMLKALRMALAGELEAVLFPKDDNKNISGLSIEITKTKLPKKGSGTIEDVFPKDELTAKRSVPVTTYDPDQEIVGELRASLAQFWRVRRDQLEVLGRVYGVPDAFMPSKDAAEGKKKAEEAKDNAATIRHMKEGAFRLDSDDDWRNFILQKYNDMVNPPAAVATQQGGAAQPAAKKPATPAEALHEIIDLVFDYLRAFTVHARFTNLYDTGDVNYLNRPFPRALTGQLVHDCGVYALRVAYMLSLVRDVLGLKFYFVWLPVHVMLVITGGTDLPAYVVTNNRFDEWKPGQLEQKRKEWNALKDPTGAPKDEEQFLGEVASNQYIEGPIDTPFRVTKVPVPVKDAKAEQARLWSTYKSAGARDVFGSAVSDKKSDNYLFQQNYLDLIEELRDMHNAVVVPFWNEAAPGAWDKLQKRVFGDPPKQIRDVDAQNLAQAINDYHANYTDALKPVKKRYDEFFDKERELSQRLHADPKLVRPDARITSGVRAASATMFQYFWDQHTDRIDDYLTNLVSRKAGNKEPVGEINNQLKPFFVPREEKRVEPLD